MPWNGAGAIIRTDGTRTGSDLWQQARDADVDIEADDHDVHDEDLADAIEKCLNRDGENAMAANVSWGGFKITSLGTGAARTDSLNLGQAQDDEVTWGGVAGGTANALELALSPAITEYKNGMKVRGIITTANTSAATLKVNNVGAVAIHSRVGTSLTGFELRVNRVAEFTYVSAGPCWVLTSRIEQSPVNDPFPLPAGHQQGQTLAQAADTEHDITVSAGSVRDDTGAGNIILGSAITKRIDAAWTEGTDVGGLDTGTVANNTWYSVMSIARVGTGVADVLFTASPDSPTLPTNYTIKRHRGWVLTDGSANIIAFRQSNNRFLWDVPVRDLSDDVVSASAEIKTITAPPGTRPVLALSTSNTSALRYLLVTETVQTDTAAAAGVHTIHSPNRNNGATNTAVLDGTFAIDSSRQLRMRASADVDVNLMTLGWIDERAV